MKHLFRIIRNIAAVNAVGRYLLKSMLSRVKYCMPYWPVSGVVDYKIGKNVIKFVAKGDDALASKLYYGEKWESEAAFWFSEIASRSSVVFDVGANIGFYSVLAAEINPNAKIFAFEPFTKNIERLKENIAINSAHNVSIIPKAVGASNGRIELYAPDKDLTSDVVSVYKSHTQSFNEFSHSPIRVDLIAIDTFCEERQIFPQLIKIDVEIYEDEVLKGMKSILTNQKPIVLIEVFNDKIKRSQNEGLENELAKDYTLAIENFLLQFGYSFYLIGSKGILAVRDLRSSFTSMYLLTPKPLCKTFYSVRESFVVTEQLFP